MDEAGVTGLYGPGTTRRGEYYRVVEVLAVEMLKYRCCISGNGWPEHIAHKQVMPNGIPDPHTCMPHGRFDNISRR